MILTRSTTLLSFGMKTTTAINHRYIRCVAMVVFILISQVAPATSYVTLNDGRLLVFPDSCVQSITRDDGSLSFVAHDGSVFTYPLSEVSSISPQPPHELPSITAYEFDNKCNYQLYTDASGNIDGNDISVEVAGIGKWLTATFTLSDDAARVYVDGTEQKSGESRQRFAPALVYSVGYPGHVILSPQPSGSYSLEPYGRQYTVTVTYLTDQSTTVPRIDINTKDGVNITSKEVYVDAEINIDGAGVFPSMTDSVKIKGRGNNSWSSNPDSKNPYRLKFADKVKPFGLTKGKNWVLLSNRIRGSLLTNAIGMKAASLLGTEAVNHIIPVDLYINGTYKGSYNFTEKVGFSNNSVDLDDESVAALLELDLYYDEISTQKFRSSPYNLPVNIKEPEFSEGTTLLTLNDIRQRFNSFAKAVYDQKVISDYAEIDQLARFLLFNYYICNMELYHPKSTYCYYENVLDENSKLIFGPVWDLDWAFGFDGGSASSYFRDNINRDYFQALTTSSCFNHLGKNPQVANRMFLILRDFMSNGLEELCDFCQEYYDYAQPSILKNKAAALDGTDYAKQISKATNWLNQRAEFIYEELKRIYEMPGDVNDDREINIGDVNALIDIILGGYADAETRSRADVNSDDEISLGDINALIDLILAH